MKTNLAPEERLTLRGLVLREYEEKGANRTLGILTADRGMLRAAAFGSGQARSALAGATQMYTYGEYTLLAKRGAYRIEEAAAVMQFRELTQDFIRFSLAAYFAELLSDAAPAGQQQLADIILEQLEIQIKHNVRQDIIAQVQQFIMDQLVIDNLVQAERVLLLVLQHHHNASQPV